MAAYYNENEKFAAAWLRELIKENLIAPGEVDERSIEEVKPDDLRGFTQCHFFAGIGVWSYALRNAGWADDSPVWTGSCPCQSFSQSGKGEGFSDKRHLWPAWFRLISECRPIVCFGEQVASKDGLAWFDVVSADLEGAGYAVGATDICTAGVGAPHIRQRLYLVAHTSTERRNGQRLRLQPRKSQPASVEVGRRGKIGVLADTQDTNGRRTGNQGNERRRTSEVGRSGVADIVGYPAGNGSASGLSESRPRKEGYAEISFDSGDRLPCVMAQPNGVESRDGHVQRGRRFLQPSENPLAGFWANAEWIHCRPERDYPEGRWRPVEPGTFPLAHGATNRVGRLRGYGNAINAEVAQAFIEAYLEIQ